MQINLAFASDDNYVQHLAVTLFSLLKHASTNNFYTIHLLDCGINQDNLNQLKRSLFQFINQKIIVYPVDKKTFADAQKVLHVNEASYFRMLLPDLLPEGVAKVLYLDCDLLIFDDVAKIYVTNFKDRELIACVRIFHPNYQQVLERQFSIKLQLCFNSGVILMNLAGMRREKSVEELLAFTKKYNSKLLAADQDVFNVVFAKQTIELSPRWNVGSYVFYAKNHQHCQLSKSEFEKLKKNPAIVHFDGGKPWNFASYHPYTRNYFDILDQTAFKNWRPAFSLKLFLTNSLFYVVLRCLNAFPSQIYNFFETFYLKNNFLEKRYRESQELR